MQYVLLLRGINVGGKNTVSMATLKDCLSKSGLSNVRSYINSGNIIFTTDRTDITKLRDDIEQLIAAEFILQLRVVLRSKRQYIDALAQAPDWWGKSASYRHNLIFIREPVTAPDALAQCGNIKPDIERTALGDGVIFQSASIPDITRTTFIKLAGKPIYQDMTIRNYNTAQKLLQLLQA